MYYRLDWKAPADNSNYSNTDSAPDTGIPWTMGIFYPNPVPEPIICQLNPERGTILRDVYLIDIPIFSQKFIKVLNSFGIDNIQIYEAALQTAGGEVINGYSVINIVGLVECADLDKSSYIQGSTPPLMEFSKLVIDESKTKSLDFFRLGEDSLQIIISERLKEALSKAGLAGFSLVELESA